MNLLAFLVSVIAFAIGGILAWDAGFTTGAVRALYIGLTCIPLGLILGGIPALAPWNVK